MDAATASSSTVTRTLSAVDDKTAEAVASSSASAAGRPKRSAGTKKAANVSPAAETAEVSAVPNTLPLAFESRVWRDAPSSIVVGVDEAGRGPLAGPVVAAACVIFPPSLWPVLQAAAALKESAGSGAGAGSSSLAGSASSAVATTTTTTTGRPPVSGVNDSKQIDEEERELLYPRLIAAPELCFGVSVVDHAVIDRINILQATFLGMSRATASVREEACKRLRDAGIDPASVAWSTSTSAATNSSPPEAAAAGPASSSSAAAETTIPQCLLHTVYIDGPKVPFRVGFAATPGGDDPDAPPAPTDDDADGAAGSNSASSSSSSTAGKAGAVGATTASFFSSAPDAGASDVELMGDDGGIQVTINADAGGQTAGAKSANQLAQKEWNVKNRPQIYTRGLQARLGTIHTVQPVIGGDAKVYCIAAASVVAKVVRDRLMRTAHDTWPQYGFLDHKGYGTGSHMAAIAKQGCCPIHRLTFAPLKHMYPAEAEAARGGPLDPKAAAKAEAAAAVTAAGAAKASTKASKKQQSGDDGKEESAVAASAESAAASGTAAAAAASGRKRGRPAAAASTSAAAENNTKAVAAAVSSRADRAAKRSRAESTAAMGGRQRTTCRCRGAAIHQRS